MMKKYILALFILFGLLKLQAQQDPNNTVSAAKAVLADFDLDGIEDSIDIDDDNDGILDIDECNPTTTMVTFPNSSSTTNTGTPNFATLTNSTAGSAVVSLGINPAAFNQFLTGNKIDLLEGTNATYTYTFSKPVQNPEITLISISDLHILGNITVVLKDGTILNNVPFVINNTLNGFTTGSATIGGVTTTINGGNSYVIGTSTQNVATLTFPSLINLGSNGIYSFSISNLALSSTSNKYVLGFKAQFICDFDNDGIPNTIDLDSDNDGIYDVIEGGDGSLDTNNDGMINNLDTGFADGNANGMADASESTAPTNSNGGVYINAFQLDSDGDGCFDVNEAGFTDNNGDGILGNSPVTINANGVVTSGIDGYTLPNSNTYLTAYPYNIIAQPTNNATCEFHTTTLTITHSASFSQWQVSTNNGTTWSNITDGPNYNGTQTNTLTINNTPLSFNGYLYRVLVGIACTPIISNTAQLSVNASVAAPTSNGPIAVCENGSSQTLNAASQVTVPSGQPIIWYDAPTGGSVVTNPTLTSTTAATITYYAATTSSAVPCESVRIAVVLSIQAIPNAPTSTGNLTVCENGASQTLNANTQITPPTGQTITWYDAATGGSIVTNPILTSTTPSSVTYYASATNSAACISPTRTGVTLSILASPNAPTSLGNLTVCENGSSQTLDATTQVTVPAGHSVTWYDATTGGNIVTNPTLTSTTAATITYYASSTNTTFSCVSIRTAITLTIQALPNTPTSSGNITVCENGNSQTLNASTQITVPTGQSVIWYDAATGGNIVANPTLSSIVPATVTYYASATNAATCISSTRAAVTLTIQAAPNAPTSSGNIIVCENGSSQTLDASTQVTAPSGQTLTWYNAATGGSIVTNPILTSTTPATITYYASVVSNITTCPNLTRTAVTLSIQTAPNAPTSIGNLTVCENGSAQTLNANTQITVPTGQSVIWYDAQLGGNVVINPTLTSTAVATTTYYASLTYTNTACEGLRTPVILSIVAAPNAPIFVDNIVLCENGSSQTLDASSQVTVLAGETIVWYNAATGGNIVANPTLTSTTAATITYYASASNTAPCPSLTRTAVTLTINPRPVIDFDDDKICVDPITGTGNLVLYVGNQVSGSTYTYTWTPTNTNLDSSGNESPTYFVTTAGTYSVNILNNLTGCSASGSVTINVSSAPVSVSGQSLSIFGENGGTIHATAVGGFGTHEYSINNGISWQTEPVFTNLPSGTYVIWARDIERCGIVFSDSIKIITYPKFFTPNGDGINDIWVINGLDQVDAKVNIFDRYGKLLYSFYVQDNRGWDGTFNSQAMFSTDYWFVLDYTENGLPKQLKSHFALKR